MLKKYLFGLALMGAIVGCSDDYDDWSAPQVNHPEESKNVVLTVGDTTAIDLAQVKGDSVVAFVPSISVEPQAKVSYRLSLTNEAKDQNVDITADELGRVAVADLTDAIVQLYGKRPTERALYATVAAYVNVNGQVVKKTAEELVTIKATPVAPVIENAYYMVGDGIGWDYDGAVAHPFSHSGLDVYDDPVFTIVVPAPKNDDGTRKDFYFKIVPASVVASSDFNLNLALGSDIKDGDDRAEAAMKVGGGAFCQHAFDEAIHYKVTLNMMDYKLTIEPINFVNWIYMPGSPQGWNPGVAPGLQCSEGNGIYVGYGYLNGDFKFTKGHAWSDGEYNYESFGSYSEGFQKGEGININWAGEAGYYRIVADAANGALTAEKTSWGIIGPAQAGGWGEDTDLTYNGEEDCWEATLDLKADEFKFRANDDWTYDFGGSFDNLVEKAGNMKVAEAGNYTVKLYLSCSHGKDVRYCTLTKN